MTRRTPAQYKWAALEFDETILTKHFTSPRRLKIAFVVVHHMTIVGDGSGKALTGCYNTWQNREASAHYGVEEGLVRQFVWDSNTAWATGDTTGNHAGISIEHANTTREPDWRVSEKTWKTGARLAANIHKVYKLGRPVNGKTLRKHRDFASTACPGPFLGGSTTWAKYVAEAQRVYDVITATPTPVPPADPPTVPGPLVTSAVVNMGSYNAYGAKTYKVRTDRYVARRLRWLVDVIDFQEVGNGIGTTNCPMRPRLDSGFGTTYKRRSGSDGRYCYTNPARITHIKSGVITAASSTWYLRDDKQAAWDIYSRDGVRAMDVSLHLESDLGSVADAKRVAQMLNIVSQALAIAKANSVNVRNIMFAGDTNSEGMVLAAMVAAGWRNVAAGSAFEDDRTFMGWDNRASERYDYALVHKTAAEAEVLAIHDDTDISDHAELVVRRRLTRTT